MRAVFLDWNSLDMGDLDSRSLHAVVDDLQLYNQTKLDQINERIRDAQVVITNKVVLDNTMLSQAKQLRLICIAATGYNNVDLEAAYLRNITVCNVRAYATPSVTQHVFMLVLNLYRRFTQYQNAVELNQWPLSSQFCMLDFPIQELGGKTMGIIGYGELGQAVSKLAEAFGMNVLIARRNPGDQRAGRVTLNELLKNSDVVSLHCPLDENNRHLIGKSELCLMRKNALLINTARGGLVDEQALLWALKEGEIAGAGLDVLSIEPPPNDHVLLSQNFPNLIITPHIAWASYESRQRLVEQLAENIKSFTAGYPQNRLA
ncbi:MAG: 2-hydroxyacid dehydrogenase [Gammaproteobacteria bacterium]|nr:2-hydroxyacid dehydrogenase [Gammaproteobacteria bacterium]